MRIEIVPGAPYASVQAADAALAGLARGAAYEVERVDAATGAIVVTSETDLFDLFAADPGLVSVRRLGPAPKTRIGVLDIAFDGDAARAVWRAERADAAPLPSSFAQRAPRTGELALDFLDAQDRLIATAIVQDPRVIRYEGFDASGRFNAKREFVAEGETRLAVPVSAPAATASVRVRQRLPGRAVETLAEAVAPGGAP
jgi:hypothetical protein